MLQSLWIAELLKIQQERERSYSKSSNRERGVTQNPATEREELLKIQQERERTSSKSSKRERGLTQNPATEREREMTRMAVLYVVFTLGVILSWRSYVSCEGNYGKNGALKWMRYHGGRTEDGGAKMMADRCRMRWFQNHVDHFSYATGAAGDASFKQRVFVCDEFYEYGSAAPVFFYTGNEADVTLYIESNGFMWTLGKEMNALLIFAEHRYYGKSGPDVNINDSSQLQFLTAEQALADYATIIATLRDEHHAMSAKNPMPVIAFGGSYGGMLASWLRIKYPSAVDGAIAASAPILQFPGLGVPWDAYNAIVTKDAQPYPHCVENVKRAWPRIYQLAQSKEGMREISESMRLCDAVTSVDDVWTLVFWIQSAWSFLAMGDYPYPSSYMTNGLSVLPAWPMKEACNHLASTDDAHLLPGLAAAAAVFYNHTNSQCNDWNANVNKETQRDGFLWNWQYCTEMFMPMGTDGVNDMFWNEPWNASDSAEGCYQTFGIHPRQQWTRINFGGRDLSAASNIVFSNGDLDPWHPGGVLESPNDSILAILIPNAAHHLDLFWPNANDTDAVLDARRRERREIERWIAEASASASKVSSSSTASASSFR